MSTKSVSGFFKSFGTFVKKNALLISVAAVGTIVSVVVSIIYRRDKSILKKDSKDESSAN